MKWRCGIAKVPAEPMRSRDVRAIARNDGRGWVGGVVVAATIVLFGLIIYGPDLPLPFIGDDYVFLDHTMNARFQDLWSRDHIDFGWYRPWSREFHFWSLSRMAGLSDTPSVARTSCCGFRRSCSTPRSSGA
jgi:hypothetical protein